MEMIEFVGGLILCAAIVLLVAVLCVRAVEVFVRWLEHLRRRRIERVEAELDRTQQELRSTILSLAEQLGGDAHEARKALIRESYLASGRAPEE